MPLRRRAESTISSGSWDTESAGPQAPRVVAAGKKQGQESGGHHARAPPHVFSVGDVVEAYWEHEDSWYDACILTVHSAFGWKDSDKTYDVVWDDGASMSTGLKASFIRRKRHAPSIPPGGSVPDAPLHPPPRAAASDASPDSKRDQESKEEEDDDKGGAHPHSSHDVAAPAHDEHTLDGPSPTLSPTPLHGAASAAPFDYDALEDFSFPSPDSSPTYARGRQRQGVQGSIGGHSVDTAPMPSGSLLPGGAQSAAVPPQQGGGGIGGTHVSEAQRCGSTMSASSGSMADDSPGGSVKVVEYDCSPPLPPAVSSVGAGGAALPHPSEATQQAVAQGGGGGGAVGSARSPSPPSHQKPPTTPTSKPLAAGGRGGRREAGGASPWSGVTAAGGAASNPGDAGAPRAPTRLKRPKPGVTVDTTLSPMTPGSGSSHRHREPFISRGLDEPADRGFEEEEDEEDEEEEEEEEEEDEDEERSTESFYEKRIRGMYERRGDDGDQMRMLLRKFAGRLGELYEELKEEAEEGADKEAELCAALHHRQHSRVSKGSFDASMSRSAAQRTFSSSSDAPFEGTPTSPPQRLADERDHITTPTAGSFRRTPSKEGKGRKLRGHHSNLSDVNRDSPTQPPVLTPSRRYSLTLQSPKQHQKLLSQAAEMQRAIQRESPGNALPKPTIFDNQAVFKDRHKKATRVNSAVISEEMFMSGGDIDRVWGTRRPSNALASHVSPTASMSDRMSPEDRPGYAPPVSESTDPDDERNRTTTTVATAVQGMPHDAEGGAGSGPNSRKSSPNHQSSPASNGKGKKGSAVPADSQLRKRRSRRKSRNSRRAAGGAGRAGSESPVSIPGGGGGGGGGDGGVGRGELLEGGGGGLSAASLARVYWEGHIAQLLEAHRVDVAALSMSLPGRGASAAELRVHYLKLCDRLGVSLVSSMSLPSSAAGQNSSGLAHAPTVCSCVEASHWTDALKEFFRSHDEAQLGRLCHLLEGYKGNERALFAAVDEEYGFSYMNWANNRVSCAAHVAEEAERLLLSPSRTREAVLDSPVCQGSLSPSLVSRQQSLGRLPSGGSIASRNSTLPPVSPPRNIVLQDALCTVVLCGALACGAIPGYLSYHLLLLEHRRELSLRRMRKEQRRINRHIHGNSQSPSSSCSSSSSPSSEEAAGDDADDADASSVPFSPLTPLEHTPEGPDVGMGGPLRSPPHPGQRVAAVLADAATSPTLHRDLSFAHTSASSNTQPLIVGRTFYDGILQEDLGREEAAERLKITTALEEVYVVALETCRAGVGVVAAAAVLRADLCAAEEGRRDAIEREEAVLMEGRLGYFHGNILRNADEVGRQIALIEARRALEAEILGISGPYAELQNQHSVRSAGKRVSDRERASRDLLFKPNPTLLSRGQQQQQGSSSVFNRLYPYSADPYRGIVGGGGSPGVGITTSRGAASDIPRGASRSASPSPSPSPSPTTPLGVGVRRGTAAQQAVQPGRASAAAAAAAAAGQSPTPTPPPPPPRSVSGGGGGVAVPRGASGGAGRRQSQSPAAAVPAGWGGAEVEVDVGAASAPPAEGGQQVGVFERLQQCGGAAASPSVGGGGSAHRRACSRSSPVERRPQQQVGVPVPRVHCSPNGGVRQGVFSGPAAILLQQRQRQNPGLRSSASPRRWE